MISRCRKHVDRLQSTSASCQLGSGIESPMQQPSKMNLQTALPLYQHEDSLWTEEDLAHQT